MKSLYRMHHTASNEKQTAVTAASWVRHTYCCEPSLVLLPNFTKRLFGGAAGRLEGLGGIERSSSQETFIWFIPPLPFNCCWRFEIMTGTSYGVPSIRTHYFASFPVMFFLLSFFLIHGRSRRTSTFTHSGTGAAADVSSSRPSNGGGEKKRERERKKAGFFKKKTKNSGVRFQLYFTQMRSMWLTDVQARKLTAPSPVCIYGAAPLQPDGAAAACVRLDSSRCASTAQKSGAKSAHPPTPSETFRIKSLGKRLLLFVFVCLLMFCFNFKMNCSGVIFSALR